MSRLAGAQRIPQSYNRQTIYEVVKTAEDQVNRLAEGRLSARHNAMTAAPTTGAWARGDLVYNSEPSAGGFIGWVCVTAGEPGTWKTWGAITS